MFPRETTRVRHRVTYAIAAIPGRDTYKRRSCAHEAPAEGLAVQEKDDDAAMAARLQRDEAIAYRDARRRLDGWTPGETRTPVARPARSRAAVRADIAKIYAVHTSA